MVSVMSPKFGSGQTQRFERPPVILGNPRTFATLPTPSLDATALTRICLPQVLAEAQIRFLHVIHPI